MVTIDLVSTTRFHITCDEPIIPKPRLEKSTSEPHGHSSRELLPSFIHVSAGISSGMGSRRLALTLKIDSCEVLFETPDDKVAAEPKLLSQVYTVLQGLSSTYQLLHSPYMAWGSV